mmetsp:Transcript_53087/g.137298  ORF Transcript_53087/g.137298 Transcript_53087/m.137298 type:complete len:270 (+) Transcript_53087:69-878(+)
MWGKSKPPPPPPPIINFDALKAQLMEQATEMNVAIAVGAVLLMVLISLLKSKQWQPRVAVCELGPGGKPCGAVASSAVATPLPPAISAAQRSPSGRSQIKQFVPEKASRGVSGTVTLTEQLDGSTQIDYSFAGLSLGDHGFHIHETADFSNGCVSAGPHYNPFNKSHGDVNESNSHVGDLGNITADNTGRAKGSINAKLVKLSGPYSVIGRSMMIHADPDDLGKGDNSKAEAWIQGGKKGAPPNGFVSKLTGNAGARIACGEIKLKRGN